MVVRVTSLKIVGGNRQIEVVSVETPGIEALSVETLAVLVSPQTMAGLDRETTEGSCRATRQLPIETKKGLSTIHS